MIIEQIPGSDRTKLRTTLESLTRSYQRRGVSFVITTESDKVGLITLIVNGKRGIAQKNFIILFNEATSEWEAYSEGVVCKLLVLSELSTFIKSKIQNLSTLLSKI
jgi:AAA+ ATPase superfamily predicted ATPase